MYSSFTHSVSLIDEDYGFWFNVVESEKDSFKFPMIVFVDYKLGVKETWDNEIWLANVFKKDVEALECLSFLNEKGYLMCLSLIDRAVELNFLTA